MLELIGVSHRTAAVALRERLAISAHALPAALAQLRAAGLPEAVILSTCNRTELYAALPSGNAASALIECLSRVSGQPAAAFRAHLYTATDRAAAAHLFRVAAGLDSLVLGESEIAAQVKQAYQAAQALGATGLVLNRLFQRALHSTKLIRSGTALGAGQASIGSVVTALMTQQFGPELSQRHVLLWGAGKAAETSARHLIKAGVRHLWIVNRTDTKAQDLASLCQARWLAWEQAVQRLAEVDAAIVCTQAPHYVIDAADIAGVQAQRGARALALIDLAVPRNIDPAVADQPGVSLWNIDDVQDRAAAALAHRVQASEQCAAIIERQVEHVYRRWSVSLELQKEAGQWCTVGA